MKEVNKVMGPSASRSGYSCSSRSITNLVRSSQISRKSGRKGKGKLAEEKYGTKKKVRLSTASFQKKVIVFNYMGSKPPGTFTRSDNLIVARGLLPSLPVHISETELRSEICNIIKSNSSGPGVSPNDFEFINMSGKQASVPQCKEGFEWDGRSVKELAGSGCVYVRLTKSLPITVSSSSDSDDFPQVSVKREDTNNETRVLANAETGSSSSLPCSSRNSSTLPSSTIASGGSSPFPSSSASVSAASVAVDCSSVVATGSPSVASSPSASPLGVGEDEVVPGDPKRDLSRLLEMFPDFNLSQLDMLYHLSKCSFSKVVDSVLEGISIECLRSLAYSTIVVPLSESPRICLDVDDDEEDWVQAAISFYKDAKFDRQAPVRISIRGQPAVDTGGVQRQFFSVVFSKLADSSSVLCLFEGPPNRLRPAYKASLLSSGLLKIFGTMVAQFFA